MTPEQVLQRLQARYRGQGRVGDAAVVQRCIQALRRAAKEPGAPRAGEGA